MLALSVATALATVLLKGVAAGAPKLAADDGAGFLAELARHLPQRPEKPAKPKPAAKLDPKPAADPAPVAEAAEEDLRSPLQRLADRFR